MNDHLRLKRQTGSGEHVKLLLDSTDFLTPYYNRISFRLTLTPFFRPISPNDPFIFSIKSCNSSGQPFY